MDIEDRRIAEETIRKSVKLFSEGFIHEDKLVKAMTDSIEIAVDIAEDKQQENERLKGDKWISVEDEVPNNFTDNEEFYIVLGETGVSNATCIYQNGNWHNTADLKSVHNDITHWQPLPTEPKENR